MKVKLLSVLCLLIFSGLVKGAAVGKNDEGIQEKDEDIYGDLGDEDTPKDEAHDADYYDETDDDRKVGQSTHLDDNDINVKLVSTSQHLIKETGLEVRLPCKVDDKKADVMRTWLRNSQVLYQGPVEVNKIDNIRLENNGNLVVKIMDNNDYGEYNCTLLLREHMNPYVIHTISPPEPARIIRLVTNTNSTEYREGDALSLICQATGNPKPKITWHRHNGFIAEGEQLSFDRIDGKHDGVYRCLADNRVGQPAHAPITVNVKHKPTIEVEKFFINSEHKHQAELICHIDAKPKANVSWKKNGVIIPDSVNKYGRKVENKKNILIIKNIDESDFAEYTCHASNEYGQAEESISLVKLPVVQFQKPTNDSGKDVILMWRVESKQPISQHELQYRKKGEETWKTISPDVSDPENDVYLIQQKLQNLEPGTYETRARSRNNHGWSNYSDIMPFDGAKHGSHQKKHHKNKDKNQKDQGLTPAQTIEEIPDVGAKVASSGWSAISSSVVTISAVLISIFFHRP